MLVYLSADWISAVDTEARSDSKLAQLCADTDLVLQQVIVDGPNGKIEYTISLAPGSVGVTEGSSDNAHLTISQTYATAVAVYSGQLNALKAVQDGQIQLTGDSAILGDHSIALGQLQASFDAVRARTSDP